MLIDLKELCKKHNFIPRGVIHVGAHTGEERKVYNELGIKKVIWIEALIGLAYNLMEKFVNNDDYTVIHAVVSDKDTYSMFHTTNNFASSSLLELGTHLKHHPKIHNIDKGCVRVITMDQLIKKYSIKITDYDMLNLDIQGAELMALKGMSKNLKHIKYIYTEVNTEEVYKGCCLMEEIDEYLTGFERKDTDITKYCWGDALYLRK